MPVYKLTFEEKRRYSLLVKAPPRDAAETWADNVDDLLPRIRDNLFGEITKDEDQFECQEGECIEDAESYSLVVDPQGNEIDDPL